jgi:hypothetical protein
VRIRDTENSKEKKSQATEALRAKFLATDGETTSSKMASLESQLRSAKQKLRRGATIQMNGSATGEQDPEFDTGAFIQQKQKFPWRESCHYRM